MRVSLLVPLLLMRSLLSVPPPGVVPPPPGPFDFPVFDDIPGAVQHVLEDWSATAQNSNVALASGASNLYTRLRSDGGNAWNVHSGALATPTYFTVTDEGSYTRLRVDFQSDAPIFPHTATPNPPYTATHAARHWFIGAGDDTDRADAGAIDSFTADTITCTGKTWDVDIWKGHSCALFETANLGGTTDGSPIVLSNTADTLTFTANKDASAKLSFALGPSQVSAGTPIATWSNQRGFDLDGWLNTPAERAMVWQNIIEYTGTNYYEGKTFDLGAGQTGGFGRWLFDHFQDRFGYGSSSNFVTNLLAAVYYTDATTVKAEFVGQCPPTTTTPTFAIHQSSSSISSVYNGQSFCVWKQNRNWGTGDGQWDMTANAAGDGTTKALYEAGRIRLTIRITCENSAAYTFGEARLEMWVECLDGGHPSPIKIMEYIGDDPTSEVFGMVACDPTGSTTAPDSLSICPVFTPTARTYEGGGDVDLDEFFAWSHPPDYDV